MVSFYDYPALSSGIAIRNPLLGDTEDSNLQTHTNRTRSGKLYMYARTAAIDSFKLDFDKLPINGCGGASTLAQVKTFFETFAGQRVKYTDYNAVERIGVVTTPTISYKKGREIFGFSLEFEVTG